MCESAIHFLAYLALGACIAWLVPWHPLSPPKGKNAR